jgi:hypothetical protein
MRNLCILRYMLKKWNHWPQTMHSICSFVGSIWNFLFNKFLQTLLIDCSFHCHSVEWPKTLLCLKFALLWYLITFYLFIYLIFLVVWGFEFLTLCLLGKNSTTWAMPPSFFFFFFALVYFSDRVLYFLSGSLQQLLGFTKF